VSTDAVDLGLVLACYNEAPHFAQSMHEILKTLDDTRWSYEIIFVDDGSRDGTRALIDAYIAAHNQRRMRRIFHEHNTGRGGAVSDGFRAAAATIVGYIDIDLEVHARYIPACVRAIHEGADIATAWRIYKFYLRSLDRYMMSRGYHWLERKLLGTGLHDTATGYKFFRRDRLLPLLDEIADQGWFWDTEVMVRGHLKGYQIAEIPALFLRRFDKRSTVHGLRDSLVYFQRLLRFKRTIDKQYGASHGGATRDRPAESR
jgi:glycosyltransferase involved in cell wall biosynthesis